VAQALIHSHFLIGLSDIIAEHNGNADWLIEQAKLPESIFDNQERLISYERHTRLMDLAAHHLNFPELGLEVAQRQSVSVFGPLISMIANQSSVLSGLELFTKHLQIRAQSIHLTLDVTDDKASVAPSSDIAAINNSCTFEDHALGLAWQIIQLLYGSPCNLRAVYFKHAAPADVSPYTRYFKCPVAFDHHCCELIVEPSILTSSVCEQARQLPTALRQYLQQKYNDRLVDQVREVITGLLVTGNCTIDAIAPAMGYSTRTLQRHLKREGVTFQALVDSARHQQAQIYLAYENYRLTDVAALLGYSELSAFTRSFKRWFGMSPQKWRKELSPAH
jgi:AraC-like DNA-binding protein